MSAANAGMLASSCSSCSSPSCQTPGRSRNAALVRGEEISAKSRWSATQARSSPRVGAVCRRKSTRSTSAHARGAGRSGESSWASSERRVCVRRVGYGNDLRSKCRERRGRGLV